MRDPERYEVLGEHGRGGLGVVSRVHDKELKRDIAIKELQIRGGVHELRFVREAMITARLEHPGIVPVHEAGRWPDGTPFYAMKLVSGRPLRALIAERKTVDERIGLLHHVIAVADAIAYAHGRKIIHRDLKPANVIVGDFGETVVIDWGLAKDLSEASELTGEGEVSRSTDDQLTSVGSVLGTPAYMAPEQERGERVDQRADVFAIGAMLWELCSLQKVPPTDLVQRHRLLRRAGIDRDLVVIIDKALDPEPHGRYRDAGALAADLRAFKSGARITARNYSLPAMLMHWTQRHRALAVALLALVVLLAAGVSALAVLYGASSRNAETAQQRLVKSYAEQGRHALLEGKSDEALAYLAQAQRRGDATPATRFMVARAAQSRLPERAVLTSASGRMWSAIFSVDGTQIVTTDDRSARIWDARTSQLLFTLPHDGTVYRALYGHKGRTLVTASRDSGIKIWDPTTGTLINELTHPLPDGTDSFVGSLTHPMTRDSYAEIAIAPSGRRLAAADVAAGIVRMWDLDTGTFIAELPSGTRVTAPSIAFSSDDRWFAIASNDEIRVFDGHTSKSVLVLPSTGVRSIAFDPAGPRLAGVTRRGSATIWSIPSGASIHHLLEGGEALGSVAFSPDAALVAAGGNAGGVSVWHASTGALKARFDHPGAIVALEFDRASRRLLSVGVDRVVRVLDVDAGIPVSVLEGPSVALHAAHFDPAGQQVITASWDGTARIWDSGPSYRRWTSPPVGRACGISVKPYDEKRFVAVSCLGHSTQVWDAARGELLAQLPGPPPTEGDLNSVVAVVATQGDVVAVPLGKTVGLYRLPGGQQIGMIHHASTVTMLVFAEGQHTIVSGDAGGAVLITGDDLVSHALPAMSGAIEAVGILPDGRVVSADLRGQLRFYDPGRRTVLAEVTLPGRMRAFRYSPDSRRLITIARPGAPGPSMLWDVERYVAIATIGDDKSTLFSARFEASGQEILTASNDGVARLWDGRTGRLLQSFVGSTEYLLDATRSPDGTLVVTAGGEGNLRFWDAVSGSLLWTLRAHPGIISGLHFEGADLVTRGFTGEVTRWSFSGPSSPWALPHVLRCLPIRFDEASGTLVEQAPCSTRDADRGPSRPDIRRR